MKPEAMVVLLGVAFCLPVSATAQDEQNVGVLLTLERKRGVTLDEFEAALKKHLEFRLAEGEGRNYHVYTPVESADYLLYYVRYCCITPAEQDAADEHLYSSDIVTSYREDLGPVLENLSYQQQWLDLENSSWSWSNTDEIHYVGVTTWSVNPAKAIEMNKARASLSQLAKDEGKPNEWLWFTTLGGEETLNLATPYDSQVARAEVQSFGEFAAQHIGEQAAEALTRQFNEGFWTKEYTALGYRGDLSVESE